MGESPPKADVHVKEQYGGQYNREVAFTHSVTYIECMWHDWPIHATSAIAVTTIDQCR